MDLGPTNTTAQHLDFVLSYRHLPPTPGRRARDRHTRGRTHGLRAGLRDTRRVLGNSRHLSNSATNLCWPPTSRSGSGFRASRRRRRLRNDRLESLAQDAEEDHIRLARSSLPLPGDDPFRVRVPSLERQDAFRDVRTMKRAMRCTNRGRQEVHAAQAVSVGDLYRAGLLSPDNEHVHGPEFTLDAIVHDEPVYSITTRLAKRGKNKRKGHDTTATRQHRLDLEWDFAGLEDDEHLARYLVASQGGDDDGHEASAVPRHGYRTVWRSPVPPASASATGLSGHDDNNDDEPVPDLINDTGTATGDDNRGCEGVVDSEDDSESDHLTGEGDEMEPGWAVLSPTLVRDSDREEYDVDGAATENAATGPWILLGDGS